MGENSFFQIVTTWDEKKPSYWPLKNANMRLQFAVTDQDIYYSTFIDFKKYIEEKCEFESRTEWYPYFSNEILNELWVGPNMVKKELWTAQKNFYCPELSMLLHEEDSTDSDGNATSATIFASTAAALLALTAICAMQQRGKRANPEDHFWRV